MLVSGIFTTASDVWSWAVCVWEIMSLGMTPYGDMAGEDALDMIVGGAKLPQPEQCSEMLYDILTHCWQAEPRRRPLFQDLAKTMAELEADREPDLTYLAIGDDGAKNGPVDYRHEESPGGSKRKEVAFSTDVEAADGELGTEGRE